MKKRKTRIPRLETMEERVVPSFLGMNMPPSLTADFNKIGDDFKTDAQNIKNYVVKLNQNRSGQSVAAGWGKSASVKAHTSNELFGIPWLKI